MEEGTAIIEAVMRGDEAEARRLVADTPRLASARNAEGVSVVLLAVYHGRAFIAGALVAAGADLDIFDAAGLGDTVRLDAVLDADATLLSAYSADGWTPLHLAAFFGHAAAVQALLARGADVAAWSRNGLANQPLHAGAASQQVEVCRLLVEAGAPLDSKQHGGFTPLHEAALSGNLPLVELFLAHGADRSTRTDDGDTARDLAVKQGHEAVRARLEA